ncbi:hypothetical protein LCGC14_1860750, partial [marine sediment metagenome]
ATEVTEDTEEGGATGTPKRRGASFSVTSVARPLLDWVILGGESGPQARPMDPAWARSVRDQCVEARVPFFFKQWGGVNKKAAGRKLDGEEWNQRP